MTTSARVALDFTDYSSGAKREVAIVIIPNSVDAQNITFTKAFTTVITEITSTLLSIFHQYAKRELLGGIENVAYPRYRIASDTPTYQPVVYTSCQLNK